MMDDSVALAYEDAGDNEQRMDGGSLSVPALGICLVSRAAAATTLAEVTGETGEGALESSPPQSDASDLTVDGPTVGVARAGVRVCHSRFAPEGEDAFGGDSVASIKLLLSFEGLCRFASCAMGLGGSGLSTSGVL